MAATVFAVMGFKARVPAHRPYAAVFAKPWYGTAAIWRSATSSGFALLDTIGLASFDKRRATPGAEVPVYKNREIEGLFG